MRRSSLLLAAALLLPALPARAQAPWILPPSAILTNYDRVLIGQEEALEAGAFVARVADSTAGWYNPAGLALVRRSVIGASATGYELDVVNLGQVESGSGRVTLAQLPSFFGAVLGGDVIPSDAWRIGFSVTKPTSWSASVNGARFGDGGVSYSSKVSISTLVPTVSVAWAVLPSLRLGAGFGVAVTSISQTQILSVRTPPLLGDQDLLRTSDATGNTWGGMGSLGVQWDVTRNLAAGASLRTPTFTIIRSGSFTYNSVEVQGGGALPPPLPTTGPNTVETSFYDPDATFTYKLPLTVNLGVAWREPRFDVELDVRYHSAIAQYDILSSSRTVQTVKRDADGTREVVVTPFPGFPYEAAAVWNVAVGGRYQLDEAWSLHGGFYTDFAPAPTDAVNVFRSVNLYGFTAGAKLKGDHLSGSLGLGFSWGSSTEFQIGNAGGAYVSTRLSVLGISLLYALAYRF